MSHTEAMAARKALADLNNHFAFKPAKEVA